MLRPDQAGSLPHLLLAGAKCSSNNLGCFKAFDALNMGTTLFSAPAGSWIPISGTAWMSGGLVSPLVANGRVQSM